jgi:hypothetical protein
MIPPDDLKKQRTRNWFLLAVLIGFVVLIYGITMIKIAGS